MASILLTVPISQDFFTASMKHFMINMDFMKETTEEVKPPAQDDVSECQF